MEGTFSAIQTGVGEVADEVWTNIPRVGEQARWLETLPTKEEVERCVGQMQNRRASGEDGFMAEFLKYGGSCLLQELHSIVVRAWKYSVEAEAGQEAYLWPSEWQVGWFTMDTEMGSGR